MNILGAYLGYWKQFMFINIEKTIKKKKAMLLRQRFFKNQVSVIIMGWCNIAKKTRILLKVINFLLR